jgi:hypothetical protein
MDEIVTEHAGSILRVQFRPAETPGREIRVHQDVTY